MKLKWELFLRGGFFLTRNGDSPATTGTGIRPSPLSSHGQPHAMAASAIRANISQSLDVHGFPTAQIPFDLVVGFDERPQSGYVFVR
jgi:hypothetical protein